MFYFYPIRSKEPPILNFLTLNLAKYVYKMAATAGSSCGEVGMKFSKQELLKFFELVTKYLDAKTTPTNSITYTKIFNVNWIEIGSCEPTFSPWLL